MRRKLLVGASVLFFFVFMLLARLPASWVVENFASNLSLADVEGTAWNGSASITHRAFPVQKLEWQLSPLPLLTGQARVEININEPGVQLKAKVIANSSDFSLDLVSANIDAARLNNLGLLPYGAEIGGDVVLENIKIEKDDNSFSQAEGQIKWSPAYLVSPQAISLQAYSAVLQHEENRLVVYVRDQGGPLEVDGLVNLSASMRYEYTMNMQLREQAPQAVEAGLARLGRVDADGVVNVNGEGRLF